MGGLICPFKSNETLRRAAGEFFCQGSLPHGQQFLDCHSLLIFDEVAQVAEELGLSWRRHRSIFDQLVELLRQNDVRNLAKNDLNQATCFNRAPNNSVCRLDRRARAAVNFGGQLFDEIAI